MEVGSGVWIKNNHFDKLLNNDLWTPAIVTSKKINVDGHVSVTAKSANEETTFILSKGNLENDTIKIRGLQEDKSSVINLNNLSFLNEPEVLFCLKQRFQNNIFCTYYGPILLHVNPLIVTKDTKRDTILKKFALDIKNQTVQDQEPWNIACKVFDEMMKDTGNKSKVQIPKKKGDSDKPLSQSILISGESGSGKSEISKEILRHMLVQAAEQKQSMLMSNMNMYQSKYQSRFSKGKSLKKALLSTFNLGDLGEELDDEDADEDFIKKIEQENKEKEKESISRNSRRLVVGWR